MGCFHGDLSPSLSLPLLSLGGLSLHLRDELCESFSRLSCCSLDGGERLLQCEDFLLGESVGILSDEAHGDLPLDLGGSLPCWLNWACLPRRRRMAGFPSRS